MARRATKGECVCWLEDNSSFLGEECLPWPFLSRSSTGYGSLKFRGRMTSANRAMAVLAHGDPSGIMEAAHSCGTRLCCNPQHIRWATPKENRADKIRHGTNNNGERNGMAKLVASDVLEIRKLVSIGSLHRGVAQKFGVSRETVSEIVRRERWTHI